MENNSIASTIPVYTLSVTADLSGIPDHSIRQYIDKGLIIPFKKRIKPEPVFSGGYFEAKIYS